jgi:hypothetical protein
MTHVFPPLHSQADLNRKVGVNHTWQAKKIEEWREIDIIVVQLLANGKCLKDICKDAQVRQFNGGEKRTHRSVIEQARALRRRWGAETNEHLVAIALRQKLIK